MIRDASREEKINLLILILEDHRDAILEGHIQFTPLAEAAERFGGDEVVSSIIRQMPDPKAVAVLEIEQLIEWLQKGEFDDA